VVEARSVSSRAIDGAEEANGAPDEAAALRDRADAW
jgi:hypothetical protein